MRTIDVRNLTNYKERWHDIIDHQEDHFSRSLSDVSRIPLARHAKIGRTREAKVERIPRCALRLIREIIRSTRQREEREVTVIEQALNHAASSHAGSW